MKRILIFLMLLSFSFALYPGSLTIAPIEYKNFGDESLPAFNVTIEMDCLEGTIDQYTESSNTPVPGATGYLKYVQYQVPLISTKSTDSSGHAVHQLPGNVPYYTGLFTLTIEKAGYRKQEIHFDISGCFVNVTEPPPTPPPETENGQQDTPPPPPPLPEPEPNITPPANITQNVTEPNLTNITGNGQPETGNGESPVCPLGLVGLALSVLVVLAIRN